MRDEQGIGLGAAMLLAIALMAAPPAHARSAHLGAVLAALADVLACSDADPRICTIRTLP